jgi:signal transduction histidine kinase/ActR/RegA family two-component response regulator
MTSMDDSPLPGERIVPQEPPGAGGLDENSFQSREMVSGLLVGLDYEIEEMRQHVQKILSQESSPYIPRISGLVLEELVMSLRQANEHLVIASLDATARETKTAAAHQRQTLFLSMLAHELRNPLAPIAMSVALLGKIPDLPKKVQSLQGILARQTTHLTRLVEDLMDATRINSGKIHILKAPLLLSQLLAQAAETSQPLLDVHQQELVLALPDEEVWISGDLIRLSQLFSNLIINASKFSQDAQTIRITARQEAQTVVIAVQDEGIGIAPELLPLVFDLFTQGPVGSGLMASGLGIGLSLVRTIAQLHGGSVQAYSQGTGLGSAFTVTLPLAQDASQEAQVLSPVSEAPALATSVTKPKLLQILLIDDNPDINQTLSDFLVDVGYEVASAMNGVTGVQLGSRHRYDMICCDIGLPDIDGYEVARQLLGLGSKARLIAISGYGHPEQRERALQAGFEHFLVKPIFCQELVELIDLPDRKPVDAPYKADAHARK